MNAATAREAAPRRERCPDHPAPPLDPEHPQRTLFEDHDCAVIWEGNTHVGEVLDAATYERLLHIAPMVGRTRSPTMEELLLQAQNVKRASA